MRKLFLSLLVVLFAITAQAQNYSVSGMVTDTSGQPLANVSIINLGTRQGTVADENGKFTFAIPKASARLEFSLIGFVSQKLTAAAGKEILVKLEPAQQTSLNEVIVVGVQTQTKRTATSAISSVLSRDIENRPAPSVDQLLQGRVPGMNVQITSGEPGVAPTVVIRGNSRVSTSIGEDPNIAQAKALSGPLYIIDGIPVNTDDISSNLGATGTNFLAGINVNDIESVDVQKDAAATAAWGSRGANGVIYIKTKRGRSAKPEFRVNVYGGFVKMPELLKTATGAAERQQKMDIIRQYATPAQMADLPQMLTDRYNPSFNNATDWQGLFYRNGSIRNVDASMSAASSLLNYRVSMNYFDETGIISSFGFQRYSFRGNFDFKLSDKLNSQLVLGMSKANRERGRKYENNSDDNTPVSGFDQPSSLYRLTAFDSLNFRGLYNKLRNDNTDNYYSAALTVNYDILPALRYTLQGSVNVTGSDKDYFEPSNIDEVASLDPDATPTPSKAISQKGTYSQYFVSNTLNWNKTITTARDNAHNIIFTAGQQFSSDVINSNYLQAYRIPSNDIQVIPGKDALQPNDYDRYYTNSGYAASAMLSFLGQLQYDFNQKYILYGSYRGDASSRFGRDSKWGYFPAVGAGWVISDEGFMKGLKNTITFLKLRGSYGVSGDNSSDFYAPFNSYVISGTYNGSPAIQPDYNNGLTKNNLTWSKVIQKNIGLDVNLFRGRVTMNVDVYDKLTKDGFYNFILPFYTGFGSINFNATDLWVSNRGTDVQLNVKVLPAKSEWQWNTQVNFSYNKNLFAKLPNNNRTLVLDDYYGFSRIYSVGQPVYEMFQLKYEGVYNHAGEIPFNPLTGQGLTYYKGNHKVVPGDPKWKDVNNSGDVWPDEDNGAAYGDRIPTGDPNPKFTGGWSNEVSYKNFSLSILSIFTWKRDIINTYFQRQISNVTGGYSSNIYTFAQGRLPNFEGVDYWTPEKAADPNYKAGFPSINPLMGSYYQYIPISSMFNEDGSYFKVKNITLGYQIPQTLIDRVRLKGARVYAIVDNVLTLKNSTMPNPELVDQLGVYTGGAYPTPVKFTLGVDVRF
ncbi:SusC/RagA family TonB-linked outer membrane protein [Niabella drilacis]|uniref:TonB-linked outer membrane protein, SusC/RagA family n=1 Tax=Niabella drilacis (strain DSM 25811 / CCM 8410 / CCUG 62505 / LMG 26954 / E90) TaxID=1285928 RepID=A0A1G6LSM2_NIADE|nr:SusC/RagA family TonB-linked outer membrane protein [Niabella drilacis]SDC46262.1 TonB-linked outer membrane protein, SusC/RagA family [Niabella drilacis]